MYSCGVMSTHTTQTTGNDTMTTHHLTLRSQNAKTGPIPVSTTSRNSCPTSCPFYAKGCYAKSGPLGIHWAQVTKGTRGCGFEEFTAQIAALPAGQLWRHNQAGDLPGEGDAINAGQLRQLAAANTGKRGFTYTHKPVSGSGRLASANRRAVKSANRAGFTVNLSANTLAEADKLAATEAGPVVCVVALDHPDRGLTPGGQKVVVCPAQRVAGMTCEKCRLCANGDRGFVVAFRAHGSAKRVVDAIAKGGVV